MRRREIFESGRKVGLLQAEIAMRLNKKAIVVSGTEEVSLHFEGDENKRWVFDQDNREEKLILVMESMVKK